MARKPSGYRIPFSGLRILNSGFRIAIPVDSGFSLVDSGLRAVGIPGANCLKPVILTLAKCEIQNKFQSNLFISLEIFLQKSCLS